jgi:hypothetical protein
MENKKLAAFVFVLALAVVSTTALALNGVTFRADPIPPPQRYLLNATTDSATNTTFWYTNTSDFYQYFIGYNDTGTTEFTYNWSVSSLQEGYYNVTANVSNSITWIDKTLGNVLVDKTPPMINITYPSEGFYARGNFTFNITTTDNYNITGGSYSANCTNNNHIISWNFSCNPTNSNCNETMKLYSLNMSDGPCKLSKGASDLLYNQNDTNVNVTIDNTLPLINIATPTENQILTGSIYWINGTMTEANLLGNILMNSTNFTNQGTNTSFSFKNTSFVSDGNWVIRINYTDAAGNYNETIRKFYVDNTPPIVSLYSPEDNLWNQLNYTAYFQFTPTDASGSFNNCTLWTNETGTLTAYDYTTLVNNSQVNTIIRNNVTNMSTGTSINWTIKCFDFVNLSSNTTITGNRTLRFDSAPPPQVGGFSPSSGSSWIYLAWSAASDTGSGVKGYNVYRTDALISQEQSPIYINDTGLSCGTTYNYKVSARDYANNSGANGTTSPSTTSCGTDGNNNNPSGNDDTGDNPNLGTPEFKITDLNDTSIAAGGNGTITFKIKTANQPRTIQNIQFTLTGIDAAWYTVSPTDFSMDIDETKPITVTLTIPADAEAKMYPVTILGSGKEVVTTTAKSASGAMVLTITEGSAASTGPTGAPFTFPTILLPTNITGIILMFGLIGGVVLYIFREQLYGRLKEIKKPTFKGFKPEAPK